MCLEFELFGCLDRAWKYVCLESSSQKKRRIKTLCENMMHQAKLESRRLSFFTVTQTAIQMLERLESNSWRRSGHAPPPRYSKATHEQTSKSFHPTWLKVLHSVTGSEQSCGCLAAVNDEQCHCHHIIRRMTPITKAGIALCWPLPCPTVPQLIFPASMCISFHHGTYWR